MRLNDEEYLEFLNIHLNLMLFAGQQQGLVNAEMSLDEFMDLPLKEKFPCREAIYETPKIIADFVKENPFDLSQEELLIVEGFKNFLSGNFLIIKYLKRYTIFLKDDVVYGVLALQDSLKDMFENQTPVYVEAVLLPYRGKIIYDGMLMSSPIIFGGGMKTSANQSYALAKSNYGIVQQLPFAKPEKKKISPEDQLAFYMKNAKNRDQYAYKIEELLDQHPGLEGVYHWHWGRVFSREKKKNLKELGIHDLHFAIVSDTIIAQGESDYQVKEMVKAILPKDKWDWVFYFKL